MYGLLGLPEVEVEVIDSHDGQGYIEVIDGHLGNGIPPSRMCEFCTLERLRITACAKHDIEPIEGMDPEDFDTESVMDWIAPGMADQAPFPWCTICPNPAFSACCTEIDMGMGGQEENLCLGDMKGCGLLLCESCTVSLVNEHEGKLDGLIDELKKEKDGLGELGIRADADFLHSKGELLRRMAAA